MSEWIASNASSSGRVGYMLRMYPRFSQTFVANEIAELERQGLEVSVASLRKPTDGVFHESFCRVKARAHYFPETHHGQLRACLREQWNSFRRNPRSYREAVRVVRSDATAEWYDLGRAVNILRWAKKERVGHVHVHFGTSEATVALLANLLGGLSYSLTLHAFDIFRDNVDRPLLAKKINHSRFTVTVSEFNKRYMVENLPGVDPDKIRVNYNGIDLERFVRGWRWPSKAAEGPVEPPSVFALGRLIEKKGFIDLVRAIRRLRDEGLAIRCRIAGSGPEDERLQREIDRSNLQGLVELIGPINEQRVHELMHNSHCFALPCIQAKDGNIDALPTVLLEALACGCPVVTTRLSGNPEIVEDRVSGILVDPGDEAGLARAIRELVLDRELAARFAIAGRHRAEERFDVRHNVAVMRDWLTQAASVAKRNGRAPAVAKHCLPALAPAVEQAL